MQSERTNLLIFGYVREQETNVALFLNIRDPIKQIIVLFYYIKHDGITSKILIVGDKQCGKTSIIHQYIYKTFDEIYTPTNGIDFGLKRVRVEDKLINIQLWDLAGQQRFIGLAPTYYMHAVAAILVFDITNYSSLEIAKKWKQDIDEKVFLQNGEKVPVILFANKV